MSRNAKYPPIKQKLYFYPMRFILLRALLISGIIINAFFSYSQDTLQVEGEAFKISDISLAIEETSQAVDIVSSKLKSTESLEDILQRFNDLKNKADKLYADTSRERWDYIGMTALESEKSKWVKYQDEVKAIDKKLTDINHLLDDYLEVINKYEDKWKLTYDVAKKDSVQVVEERVQSMIDLLEGERAIHKSTSEMSYKILDSVTQENIIINAVLSEIKEIYADKKGKIFVKDSPGFFEMLDDHDTVSVATQVYHSWQNTKKENRDFLRMNKTRMVFHFFIFGFILWFFYYMRRKLNSMEKGNNRMLLFDSQILKNPIALSFLFALTLSFWYYPNRPQLLAEQLIFLIIVPATWVLYGFVRKDYRLALIVVAVLYFMLQVQQLLVGQILAQRWFMMIEALVGFGFAVYLSRPKSGIYQKLKFGPKIIRLFPLVPIMLGIAIYANYNGSVSLAKLLLTTVIKGSAVGIVLFLFISVIEGLVEFIVASPAREKVHLFKARGHEINRWTRLILRTWAAYTWIMLILTLIRVKDSFLSWWEGILTVGWDFGEVSLTVELIVEFALIIIVFSLVANITKALLEIEILPRFDLKKGIPMAIAVVTRYIILTLGFFMAVAAAGISLDKLGFLAGALGVGIGFGLQNVVGNFVSGLILVFERPIHIDDVIVTENIEGVVKEVGIRASKIRSWDGAEVIVPNMDLISRQVTNWTLSDTNRRREVILKMEYGSDPNKVIEIVKDVLAKNEEVLKEPNPMVLFLGYQQYSIDFRVLFWLNGNMLQGTSDVTLGMYNELKKAGIEVAVPRQRMIMEDKDEEAIKKAVPKKTTSSRRKATPKKDEGEGKE